MITRTQTLSVADAIAHKGYCHEREFLTPEEAQGIKEIYDSLQWASGNKNYPIKQILDCSVFDSAVLRKIDELTKAIYPDEDLMLHGAFFFSVSQGDPKKSVNFGFHQDHESFYVFQEHYYYLNLYIVIEKKDIQNSNLVLVPFDALKDRDPMMHDILEGSGASGFSKGCVHSDGVGARYRFDFDLDEIATTPRLGVGDVLAMRGDILHKTQNQAADRVAVSFRMVRRTSVCSRQNLLVPSRAKLSMINKSLLTYAGIDYVFAEARKDYLTVEELFTRLVELDKFARYTPLESLRHVPFALIWHVIKFKIRLLLLRGTCWLW